MSLVGAATSDNEACCHERGDRPRFLNISEHDSPSKAEYVLDRIESRFIGLSEFPERGVYPEELMNQGFEITVRFFQTLSFFNKSISGYSFFTQSGQTL